MKTFFYIVLTLAVLIVVRSPKDEPFTVPPGGAPVYAAPGDSLPAILLAEGDTVRLKLLDATYSTFRKNDKTWYLKRTDLVPLYWVGKMERMEQRLLDKYSLDRLPQRPAGDTTLPLLFLTLSLAGGGTLWLLRKCKGQAHVFLIATPVLVISAGIAVLQLAADDPVWFCWPSQVGWPTAVACFALFAASAVAQAYMVARMFGTCIAADSRNTFHPTYLLLIIAFGLLVAILVLYPIASMWIDVRILQNLLYLGPLLVLLIYVFETAERFVFTVRCGTLPKIAALIGGLASMLTLAVLGLMAVAILFYVILIVVGFFLLSSLASGTAATNKGAAGAQTANQSRWHQCSNCPHRYWIKKSNGTVVYRCSKYGTLPANGACKY